MAEMEMPARPPNREVWLSWGCGTLAVFLGGIWFFVLLPSVTTPREISRRSACVNQMKLIGIAIQSYHDNYNTFPPAFIADENGVPMHSWRVLLLPYLAEPGLIDLNQQYRFDEPWNGPNNRKLLDRAPAVFRCPSDEGSESDTSYLAVTGGETIWPGTNAKPIRQIIDGTSQTIAVVECTHSGVNWLEPRDVAFDDAVLGINQLKTRPAIRSNHNAGANLLFADGSVHFLTDDIPADTLRGLLTAAGGENVEMPQ